MQHQICIPDLLSLEERQREREILYANELYILLLHVLRLRWSTWTRFMCSGIYLTFNYTCYSWVYIIWNFAKQIVNHSQTNKQTKIVCRRIVNSFQINYYNCTISFTHVDNRTATSPTWTGTQHHASFMKVNLGDSILLWCRLIYQMRTHCSSNH